MKISEFIIILQKTKETYGDQDIEFEVGMSSDHLSHGVPTLCLCDQENPEYTRFYLGSCVHEDTRIFCAHFNKKGEVVYDINKIGFEEKNND